MPAVARCSTSVTVSPSGCHVSSSVAMAERPFATASAAAVTPGASLCFDAADAVLFGLSVPSNLCGEAVSLSVFGDDSANDVVSASTRAREFAVPVVVGRVRESEWLSVLGTSANAVLLVWGLAVTTSPVELKLGVFD